MRRSFNPSSPYNNFNKNDKSVSDMKCFNCERPGHFAAECNRPKKDDRYRRDEKKEDRYNKEDRYKREDKRSDDRHKKDEETDERAVERSKERSKDRRMRTRSDKRPSHKHDRKVLMAEESTKSWADTDSESSFSSSSSSDSEQEEVHCLMADQTSDDENSSQLSHEGKDGIGYQRPENPKPSWLKNRLDMDKAKAGSKSYVQHQPWRNSRKAKSGWRKTQPRRDLYGQHMKSKLNRSHCNYAQTLKDTYTGKTIKMMTAIHFGFKVNWSKVLFNVLKDMVDKSQKKAKGFAAQIGVLLKSMPAITMGDGVPFPNAKILSMKTVNTYIATNITIDARGENVEPGLAKVAVVKRTPKSKKKSSSTDETPVEVISEISGSKKRQATEAQDVVPLQIIDPTPAAAAVNSPVPKQKSRKRRLILPTGSDDESIATQKPVKDTHEVAIKPNDEVDMIIEQVLKDTLDLGVSEETQGGQRVDEAAFTDDFGQWLDDFVSRNNVPEIVGPRTFTEAEGSTSPVMLPSVTAAKITKIRFGGSIHINEVRERDVYLASLPRISIHDKGKAILEEDEPVRGNPAREMVELICGDIEFLVRLRDQVMVDVVEFFHSFSLNKLSNLDALRELKEKEKLMLEWAEMDSLEMVVKRKAYILAKYRELLLRKFLDSHRKYFAPGQPWTATTSLIIDLLSDAHSKSLEDLLAQQKEHSLPMEQPCASTMFDSSIGSGAVLARFYSVAKSTCWVSPMILVNGVLTPLQGHDFWKSSCRLSLFLNEKNMPDPVIEDNFVPHVLFIEPVQYWEAALCLIKTWRWTKVCTEIIQFSMFGCLRPVREDVCQEIVVYNLGVERLPADFLKSFAEGVHTDSFVGYFGDSNVQSDLEIDSDFEESYSDAPTVYRSPSPSPLSWSIGNSALDWSTHLCTGQLCFGWSNPALTKSTQI
ncbi:zinc finger-containing glycine-rich RNA-binding protein [Dorcoceras hygrometricum]|uniref:Zinc finger-containing glycine-rich RNA-binding protein n=1 Tax=Dorcoceras hygrometricum TaxID=472368 RepID=A0A2Z7BY74_9LAMI|nr:zinc finger-containing glycine-rich RNA-binding protein [Dorcoceras hygrometricum]